MVNESYYERNKEARCAYQREYYKSNKARINRKRQIDESTDPEKICRRLDYNRAYYRKHRKRLLAERAERYQELKTAREATKTQTHAESVDLQS